MTIEAVLRNEKTTVKRRFPPLPLTGRIRTNTDTITAEKKAIIAATVRRNSDVLTLSDSPALALYLAIRPARRFALRLAPPRGPVLERPHPPRPTH